MVRLRVKGCYFDKRTDFKLLVQSSNCGRLEGLKEYFEGKNNVEVR